MALKMEVVDALKMEVVDDEVEVDDEVAVDDEVVVDNEVVVADDALKMEAEVLELNYFLNHLQMAGWPVCDWLKSNSVKENHQVYEVWNYCSYKKSR